MEPMLVCLMEYDGQGWVVISICIFYMNIGYFQKDPMLLALGIIRLLPKSYCIIKLQYDIHCLYENLTRHTMSTCWVFKDLIKYLALCRI